MKTKEQLIQLQNEPSQIRNICILAHVDHGKTTLADALIASNGIISKRNAGKMRYMDSRPDEQERGITMKSSAITLIYERPSKDKTSSPSPFLINLIDSPGHMDFSSEVTTAVRLCDGAVVVVDVVEGVCPQTQAVMRQAWLENIRPILVVNKLDRLISELKMTPMEAYQHLIQVMEQVNLVTNQLFTSEAMEKFSNDTNEGDGEGSSANSYDWTVIEDEEDCKNIYFSPDQGNVVFASALDSWGFSMSDFARMYSTKLGVQEHLLHRTMWGDYYLNMKSKRIMKGAQSKGKKPLFVQFVLENIWAVYDAVIERKDKVMTEKITKSLGLTVKPRDFSSKDVKVPLQAIMSQWLPLSDAILEAVTVCTPSPLDMTEEKVEKLICSQNIKFSSLPQPSQDLQLDFEKCNSSEDAPVIVYVSKMFPVERKCLPQGRARPLTEEELQWRRDKARRRHAEMLANKENGETNIETHSTIEESAQTANGHFCLEDSDKKEEDPDDLFFIAFARVFSGVLTKGKTMYFLGPKHNPAEALQDLQGMSAEDFSASDDLRSKYPHITTVEVKDLYLLMGRELEALDRVPAGNVVGIGGMESCLLKSGTLASTVACPAFTDMYFDTAPIMRVAVEPAHAVDLNQLSSGLRLLNQADPCVEVRVQETGEHVIIAAGEVHLQRCLDDLMERYAKIEVNVSKPIVPFRETVIIPPTTDMVNEAVQDQTPCEEQEYNDNPIQISTADRQCHLLVRAAPLPGNIPTILLDNQNTLKALDSLNAEKNKDQTTRMNLNETTVKNLVDIKEHLKTEFAKAGPEWEGAEDHIWSFGPRRCGPNILLNKIKNYSRNSIWQALDSSGSSQTKLAEFDNSVVSGFQMATLAGPLCEEPMHGVCFVIKNWWFGDGSNPPDDDVQSCICSGQLGDNDVTHTLNCDNSQSNSKLCERLTSVTIVNSSSQVSESINLNSSVKNSRHRKDQANSVTSWSVLSVGENIQRHSSVFGPLSGQLISSMKEGCRRAFQARPQRLMAAMYICNIQATVEVLGKLYAVLGKRFGRVMSEEMQEGSNTFTVSAVLPVVESFGFSEDMRKKTSGLASPQLKFSHWEVISMDPFWVPTTEEEYMHYGEKADAENRARHYMNKVRRRKGLKTDEKIVEFGDKQRTLTKMK